MLGCGGGPPPEPTATVAPTPTAVPTPTPTASELLAAASRRLAETQTVHFELDVEGTSWIDMAKTIRLLQADGDLQRPDRVRTRFQAELFGTQTVTIRMIIAGELAWITDLVSGKWIAAPPEFAYRPTILFDNQEGIGPVMGRVGEATRLEDTELDGRPVYHVVAQVDDSIIGPLTYYTMTGSPISVELWIARDTLDLLRARMAEPPGEDRPNPAVWMLNLSHHGEPITIELPLATPTE
jgi:hypothetical protein